MVFRLLLAATMFVCGTVSAAGAYDGIYQTPAGNEWYSVHQSGNRMIVGGFFSNAQSILYYTLNNGQFFIPPRLDNWDLFGGTINGNVAVVVGDSAFGACNTTIQFNFGDSPVASVIGMVPTISGAAQGINCASVYANMISRFGRTFQLVRIF